MSESHGRVLNCVPSRNREQDWSLDNMTRAGMGVTAEQLPESVDLRDPSWWAIGDQGQTGSCVGWASADSVIRYHLVRNGRLSPSDLLSVRFQWMAAKELDEFTSAPTTFIEFDGTSLKAALDVARKYGSVPDAVLPFQGGGLYQGDTADFYLIAARFRIASYVALGSRARDWKRWLARRGPILTRLDCDDAWFRATESGGVLAEYQLPDEPAGHAVAVVGYTPDHFIIRNSWGTGWGDGHGDLIVAPDRFHSEVC